MLITAGLIAIGLGASLGLGILLQRLIGSVAAGAGRGLTLGDLGLLGLLGLAALATAVNLVLPLSRPVGLAILLLGAAGLVLALVRPAAAARPWLSVVAVLLVLAALVLFCARWGYNEAAHHYDTGLYHLQAIAMAEAHPTIVGIGQVHMRFGYNAILFPLAATLAAAGSIATAAAAVNGLVLIWVTLAVGERLLRPGATRRGASWLMGAAVLAGMLLWPDLRTSYLGNPNTDLAPRVLLPYAFMLALALVERREAAADGGAEDEALMLVVAAVFAVTVKLSNLAVLPLLLVPLLAWRAGLLGRPVVGAGLAIALAAGLPWLLRGVLTSGCLAYPVEASCLPLPWRTDPAIVAYDTRWMRAWARLPETDPVIVLADWKWLGPWLASLPGEPVSRRVLQLLAIAGALGLLRLAWPGLPTPLGRLDARQRRGFTLVLATALGGVLFWFLSAPLLRYGAIWLILPPLILAVALLPWPDWVALRGARPGGPHPALLAAIAVAVAYGLVWPMRKLPRQRWLEVRETLFPAVTLEQVGTLAGAPLLRPRGGNQCWDAPLFCSPYARAGELEARQVGPWLVVRRTGR